MWWRFRKHRPAMVAGVVMLGFYLAALLAPFLATAEPTSSEADRSLMPPQKIHWFDGWKPSPHVFGVSGKRDQVTFKRVYTVDEEKKLPVRFFSPGFEYKLLWLIPTDRHLVGVKGAKTEESIFILGTDLQGRDVYSRLLYATRISMSIGLVGVTLSLFLGIMLGGISGFYGGFVDTVIQRGIEILRSVPTIPLWMGLAAALPSDWVGPEDLLCYHYHYLGPWVDGACPRGPRKVPGFARGGLRDGGDALRGQPHADHLSAHGALLLQPHHCGQHPGDP